MTGAGAERAPGALDALDRRLIEATQGGLPLDPRPYARIAEAIGCAEDEVIARLSRMIERGIVRRIGAVPNHYALGYRANGMSVWNVDDGEVDRLGRLIGAFDFVTHCYRRPRHPPLWPYNLFAMVHGRTGAEVDVKVAWIGQALGAHCHDHDVLMSTRMLKKTGLRLRPARREATCSA